LSYIIFKPITKVTSKIININVFINKTPIKPIKSNLQYEAGSYWKHQDNDIKLIIAHRPPHQVTAKKPPHYLLLVDNDETRHYVSSLYRIRDKALKFTYNGYLLKLEADAADFAKCSRIIISTLLHFLQHQPKNAAI
jgi:hypothetical protein